ncbi:MAG: hypothetical protein ACUVTP_08745 [Candidatus Fervidibacter sp.]|uniref:hypothetical protein n=1 Tax=Candidatus Fervidibacter sp. TaxID=3100871 RepID=UPI00404B8CEE
MIAPLDEDVAPFNRMGVTPNVASLIFAARTIVPSGWITPPRTLSLVPVPPK